MCVCELCGYVSIAPLWLAVDERSFSGARLGLALVQNSPHFCSLTFSPRSALRTPNSGLYSRDRIPHEDCFQSSRLIHHSDLDRAGIYTKLCVQVSFHVYSPFVLEFDSSSGIINKMTGHHGDCCWVDVKWIRRWHTIEKKEFKKFERRKRKRHGTKRSREVNEIHFK